MSPKTVHNCNLDESHGVAASVQPVVPVEPPQGGDDATSESSVVEANSTIDLGTVQVPSSDVDFEGLWLLALGSHWAVITIDENGQMSGKDLGYLTDRIRWTRKLFRRDAWYVASIPESPSNKEYWVPEANGFVVYRDDRGFEPFIGACRRLCDLRSDPCRDFDGEWRIKYENGTNREFFISDGHYEWGGLREKVFETAFGGLLRFGTTYELFQLNPDGTVRVKHFNPNSGAIFPDCPDTVAIGCKK